MEKIVYSYFFVKVGFNSFDDSFINPKCLSMYLAMNNPSFLSDSEIYVKEMLSIIA